MCDIVSNPLRTPNPFWVQQEYAAFDSGDIRSFHSSIPGYYPTPLESLPSLAGQLGIAQLLVKDESQRFGLKAFKAMGASYAIYRFIKQEWERRFGVQFETENLYRRDLLKSMKLRPFCTATDGNHGRAVAWFAKMIGQSAVIYVPSDTVKARIDNIRGEGAEVVVVDGNYDDAVARVANDAGRNGWQVISDTSYPGYTQIPAWIMAGYTTMFEEIDEAMADRKTASLTHVFIQSGVGSFAGSAAWYYYRHHRESLPALISVEPTEADCLLESVRSGNGGITPSRGSQISMMAGLNCGTPSLIAWPLIRDGFSFFLSLSDDYAKTAMRRFFRPLGEDPRIISGESGAAGLAGLTALLTADSLSDARKSVGLTSQSRVLVFNTEGDTDPTNFQSITAGSENVRS